MWRFIKNEAGSVTVDWVVLTAALVGMVVAVFTIITEQSLNFGAQRINSNLEDAANFSPDFSDGPPAEGGDAEQAPPADI
jgi:hypothetical protein